ncbi:MAG: bifunctional adenosylcobinamide kinase/adenosylcobinamide-phosphate guanylyltransferase [Oscillospiraceae bacterium]|jgi:adenosylcobinamide kinase/adenosylcobinamide-phosphate guanylyltransferase
MARVYVITGGVKTGKSRWAVSYFADCSFVRVITAGSAIEEETQKRIDTHMRLHPGMVQDWSVVSEPLCPSRAVETDRFFIIDSISTLVSNSIYEYCESPDEMSDDDEKKISTIVIEELAKTIDKVKQIDGNVILITTEAGFSCIPDKREAKAFRDILGAVNQRICGIADEVYLSVSGIQIKIK